MKKKIAVLTSGWTSDYVLAVIEGMKKVCERNFTDLFVFTCYKFVEPSGEPNTTSFAVFDLINYKDYDGIVIMPNLFNDQSMVEKYAAKILESKVPAVSINQPLEGFHFINSENHNTVKELVLHLINEHDVKTFGFIGGPEDNPGVRSNYKAFLEALEEAGLNKDDSVLYYGNCDWTYNSAYIQAQKLFGNRNNIPNGIVCINDEAAMAVTKVAVEEGFSVPDDVKIVGFDNLSISSKIIPSLTTVTINEEKIGEAAINLLLDCPENLETRVVQADICKRQSCGCVKDISKEQILYSYGFLKEIDKEKRFESQLRYLEDRFIRHNSIPSLSKDLQNYYEKRHLFEGPDFTIFIDKDVLNNIREAVAEGKTHPTYGSRMQAIANIQDGFSAPLYTINTQELIPQNMKVHEPCVYLVLPIFNQKYVHGYYVSKNFTNLLMNKFAYNWTRNIGSIIEKFRQTLIYKTMSKQLEILSRMDSLSGLMNRSALKSYGEEILKNNNKLLRPTQIIFVDINNMKHINDKFGHLQGDFAISAVANAISASVASDYIAIRYGGDEFVLIGYPDNNVDVCARITKYLEETVKKMTLPYKLTASLGVKNFAPNETDNLNDAIKEVDEIMYKVKQDYHKKSESRNQNH